METPFSAFNASAPPSAATAALMSSAGPSWAAANCTSAVLASNAADTPKRCLMVFPLCKLSEKGWSGRTPDASVLNAAGICGAKREAQEAWSRNGVMPQLLLPWDGSCMVAAPCTTANKDIQQTTM